MPEFLNDFTRRPLTQSVPGLTPVGVFIGPGQLGLEVALYEAASRPTTATLQKAWKERRQGRSVPLLTVVLHGGRAWVYGPAGEDMPPYVDKDASAIERLCAAALEQPDRHSALLFLAGALPSLDTAAPGLRNQGLFASHELIEDAPRQADWQEHVQRGRSIVRDRVEGQDLLKRLGYSVERIDNLTHLLKGRDRRLALAVLLDRSEIPEDASQKFGNLSPVSYALAKADNENLEWVVVAQGDRLRLYPTKPGIGVGRRGRTETYVEVQTTLLADEQLAFLSMLFSAEALAPDGSVQRLLKNSERFAANLATRLRDRIYQEVMPLLAKGVTDARKLSAPTADDLDLTYRMALTILFRLLFVAYAEDKDLLPYAHSEAYRVRSLKQKARELAAHYSATRPIAVGTSHWDEVSRIWRAVSVGDTELMVPPYNGNLFTSDARHSEAGGALTKIALPNEVFEPALRSLLLSDVDGGLQPVDFRSLGVREFGTIYEGLLESELSVAEQDLMLDRNDSYVPLKGNQEPIVRKGEVYLHDRSGARKSSGSYFTKSFAVEHLLDRALMPALTDHLARVAAMGDADAGEAFFDFRVADIAMGSGHFLVAAVDRIEQAFTEYLARPNAPGASSIRRSLEELKTAARTQLGELADQMTFEDGQVLRRLIARRCIYGVDLNPLTVELARLAIWIHTFVPGLPLSVLDHNLVNGNALVGVGTVAEIREAFEKEGTSLFPVDADNLLGGAAQPLRRLANISDASLMDVAKALGAIAEARVAVEDTRALCDIITAQRLDPTVRYQFTEWEKDRHQIQSHKVRFAASRALEGLKVFHFPVAFPEVFLRRRSGFDVLLGNPPWKSPVVHELAFWARHFPGLRGMNQQEKEAERKRLEKARPDLAGRLREEVEEAGKMRKALTSGIYPGMGTGDPDVYKAFAWRFWHMAVEVGGRIGVVLPRSAMAAKGSETFRKEVFKAAVDVDITMVLNNRRWVFDEVHAQYTIGFCAVTRGRPDGPSIGLRGPFANLAAFQERHDLDATRFAVGEVLSWNDEAALPLLPSETSLEVFTQLRRAPRLDTDDGKSWRARPYAEAHSSKCRAYLEPAGSASPDAWPVWKGESFDLDRIGTAEVYGHAKEGPMAAWLEGSRRRQVRGSAYAEFSREWAVNSENAPRLHPRIVYRDVARATDTRTMIVALAPPRVFLADTAPYILWPRGDGRDEAYLLGVLRSRPLDWYVRRFAETHVKYFLVNSLPIPRPLRGNPLWLRTVAIAGRLAAKDDRFAEWAERVGVDWGPIPSDQELQMIDELDAVVAHLYGLNDDQLRHVFETFHEGWDWEPRFAAVHEHYRAWMQKE